MYIKIKVSFIVVAQRAERNDDGDSDGEGALSPLNLKLAVTEQKSHIVCECVRHRIGTPAACHCKGIRTRVTLESHISLLASFLLNGKILIKEFWSSAAWWVHNFVHGCVACAGAPLSDMLSLILGHADVSLRFVPEFPGSPVNHYRGGDNFVTCPWPV